MIVEVGATDSEDTTVLHVPDLELVVAGDVIYNGVHMYLAQHRRRLRALARRDRQGRDARAPSTSSRTPEPRNTDDDAVRLIAETAATSTTPRRC